MLKVRSTQTKNKVENSLSVGAQGSAEEECLSLFKEA